MKKLATLILAAAMVVGASTGASAIDFKAKGQWIMSFDYGQNGNFEGKYKGNTPTGWNGSQDDFEAVQRVRLQLDAVASEALSGTVFFEIGKSFWGKADGSTGGAALGADSSNPIKLKSAYIDWIVPETDVKVRMGLQGMALPSFTTGSTVFNDDVAGITVSAPINEMVGVTAFWARPLNDNFAGFNDPDHEGYRANYMDNLDAFGLLVPLTFDGAKITPWGMYAGIGPNTFRNSNKEVEYDYDDDGNLQKVTKYTNDWYGNWPGTSSSQLRAGLFPVGGARHRDFSTANGDKKLTSYGNAWWGGITGDITIWDPFRVAFDFTYGSVNWEDDGRLNRAGWLANLLIEYKLDWGIPGIYGWYASGDDSNPANGSERLPTLSANNTNNGFSNFAFNGAAYIEREGVISSGGMAGTWGIGARLKDMSFVEDLKHTFRINYIGGTNSPTMGKKMSMAGMWANGTNLGSDAWGDDFIRGKGSFGIGHDAMYLTTMDSALEVGLTNTYKMYENFVISLEADYVALWLDTSKSVWGARHRDGKAIPQTKDAWNINASFVYSF